MWVKHSNALGHSSKRNRIKWDGITMYLYLCIHTHIHVSDTHSERIKLNQI